MKKNTNKGDWIFGISLAVGTILLLSLIFIFKDGIKKDDGGFRYMANTVDKIDLKEQPMLGNPDAEITIVEYGDYKCPACSYFTSVVLHLIQPEYIDSGRVNYIFKDFPFKSEDSYTTAIYAEGIRDILGDEAFWKFNKRIFNDEFENNESISPKHIVLGEKELNNIAKDLFGENDVEKLKDVLDTEKYVEAVMKDKLEGENININSTPTVLINGKKVLNALNYENVIAAIGEEMEHLDDSKKEKVNEKD